MCGDSPGGSKTFAEQVCIPINGKVQCIDLCIHQIVSALNAGGVETMASCCGHGDLHGNISLEDGRVLVVYKSYDEWSEFMKNNNENGRGESNAI